MPDDTGLPAPPIRRPAPAQPPRADVPRGLVNDSLDVTRLMSDQATSKWGAALSAPQTNSRAAPFRPFQAGDNALAPVQSLMERQQTDEPGFAGMLKSVGKGILQGLFHPFASTIDQSEVSRINDLQAGFLKDHDAELRQLSDSMASARDHAKNIGNLLAQSRPDSSKMDSIVARKKAMGANLRDTMQASLDAATDPDEKNKIQSLMNDLDGWSKDRDSRVQAEQPEVDDLRKRMNNLNREMTRQANDFGEVGMSRGPSNEMGSARAGEPSRVISTTHTTVQAIQRARMLQNFFLGRRADLTRALGAQ
jgi:hypothetical protein